MDYEIAAETPINNVEQMTTTSVIQSNKTIVEVQKNKINPTSQVTSIKQAIFSRSFVLIIVISLTTMSGFLIISSYKLLSQRYGSGDDTLVTLFASLGFLLFGTARLTIRGAVMSIGFKLVFYIIGVIQIISSVSLYYHYVGINIAIFIYIQGCLINWFNLFIPRVFGFKHALQLIQTMLIVFSIGNGIIHILHYYLDISTLMGICIPITVLSILALMLMKE